MGTQASNLRKRNSSATSLNSNGAKSRSLQESLVRERDRKQDMEEFYEVVGGEIGRGGLCRILKIKKKDDKIGGSSRPEHVRRKRGRASLRLRRSHRLKNSSSEPSLIQERHELSGNFPLFFALKVINLTLVKEDKIDQLKNEVEILKTLDHMNIIKAYETFQARDSRQLMIVMELCTGGDLYARIPYSEPDAAHITKQIISAVSYMHNRKIVHRDLKFENIIFESNHPEAPIKVIDFGLSKEYSPEDHKLEERVGTLYSMSPETMQGSYDERADLWSLGVCTYMLLAGGTKPFDGRTPKEMVTKVLKGRYSFEDKLWSSLTDQSKEFIRGLLKVNPNDRPSAAQAWKHAWFQQQQSSSSAHSSFDDDSDEEEDQEELKERVCDCIVQYADTGPFRKLALNVIAKRSTSSEIFQLRKVFYSFDTLNTGTLTYGEFHHALKPKYPHVDLEKIFKSLDLNRTNVINYTEFLAACLEAQGELEEYRIAEAFDLMDADDSGYISRDNLRQILGEHSNEKYIDALIAEADFDKNGKITYSEFLQIFSRQCKRDVELILNNNDNNNNKDSGSLSSSAGSSSVLSVESI